MAPRPPASAREPTSCAARQHQLRRLRHVARVCSGSTRRSTASTLDAGASPPAAASSPPGAFPTSAYGVPDGRDDVRQLGRRRDRRRRVQRPQRRAGPDHLLDRRRRHLRHRHGHALRRRRAQRGHHLHLLRQRDLRQHRRAAQQRHAAGRQDHDHGRGQGASPRRTSWRSWPRIAFRTRPRSRWRTATTSCARSTVARHLRGFRFLLMLSPCPTGWKSEPAESVDLMRAGGGLRPVPAVRGLRRPALPHQRRARTARRSRTTSRGSAASRRRSGRRADPRADIAEQWARLEALAAAFPTSDAVAGAAPRRAAGCGCWWRTSRRCWRGWPARSRGAAGEHRDGRGAQPARPRPHVPDARAWTPTRPTAGRLADGVARLDSVLDAARVRGRVPGRACRRRRPASQRRRAAR